MKQAHPQGVDLIPIQGAATLGDRRFCAVTSEPWLRLIGVPLPSRGALWEITYSAGLTDKVARPVFRFVLQAGEVVEALGPAPSEGAGIWRGRLPPHTKEIWVSPVDAEGPFAFSIESIKRISLKQSIRARVRSPKRAFFSGSARMVGLEKEADLNLRFVLGRAEEPDFDLWRKRRRRRAAPAPDAPPMLVVIGQAKNLPAVRRTYLSLRGQTSPNWTLALHAPSPAVADWLAAHSDVRLALCNDLTSFLRKARAPVAFLEAGDRLAPHALAAFTAHFERHPEQTLVYSDDVRTNSGLPPQPFFKPDWSPVRQRFTPYVGRAAFLREDLAAETIAGAVHISPENLIDLALWRTAPRQIGHIARLLVDCGANVPAPGRPPSIAATVARPTIGIIVPTRDRVDLLDACLNSVLERTAYADFELLVVDNGSVEKKTRDLFAQYASRDARVSVLSRPGPFNFAYLCNEGAKAVAGDVLVFLNNDTLIVDEAWLDKLLDFALEPDIGAVGAKLLYPSSRVQHVGVVLGMGGVAGHFGEGLAEHDENWIGWNTAPHEASAVTAACLMVERKKFEAVGGYDSENLPVDLNDVDLCLRLREAGWRTICDCRTTLVHHQSASRGGSLRLQKVYARERTYFSERWRAEIRSEPCFNPNLSLYDRTDHRG